MNLLFDTNILLTIIRDKSETKALEYLNLHEKIIFISVTSYAEIQSISLQNKWGMNKTRILESLIEKVRIVEISEYLVPYYVDIDTYSQRLNPNFEKYTFDTPQNMGKNDLWIAATASFLNLQLVTTDSDFDHLGNEFIALNKISTEKLAEVLR